MRAESRQEFQRYLLCVSGILLALPVLALILLAFALPITNSGIGYLSGSVLVITGLILVPWARRYSALLTITGLIIITSIASLRLILARQDTTPPISMITLPQGNVGRSPRL